MIDLKVQLLTCLRHECQIIQGGGVRFPHIKSINHNSFNKRRRGKLGNLARQLILRLTWEIITKFWLVWQDIYLPCHCEARESWLQFLMDFVGDIAQSGPLVENKKFCRLRLQWDFNLASKPPVYYYFNLYRSNNFYICRQNMGSCWLQINMNKAKL